MKKNVVNLVIVFITLFESGALILENDIPDCKDVTMFLDSIDKGLKYTEGITADDDIGFGLLYVRENLERILRFLRINHKEPLDLLKRVNELRAKVKQQLSQRQFTLIGPLFDNMMIVPLTRDYRYKTHEFNQKPIPTIQEQFLSIRDYNKAVANSVTGQNSSIPSINFCLTAILHKLSQKKKFRKPYCKIDKHCHRLVMSGPDFGYGLTRRLLSLIIPNSQKCFFLSAEGDQRLTHMLCSAIYNEALYTSNNNYLIYDLLMEQIPRFVPYNLVSMYLAVHIWAKMDEGALCTALGYTHFMNRNWLSKVLNLQEDNGCFRNPQARDYTTPKLFQAFGKELDDKNAKNVTAVNNACSYHLTSVSMAMAAATSRYTIEKCLGKYRLTSSQNFMILKAHTTQSTPVNASMKVMII